MIKLTCFSLFNFIIFLTFSLCLLGIWHILNQGECVGKEINFYSMHFGYELNIGFTDDFRSPR
jgi:hypothetical protein